MALRYRNSNTWRNAFTWRGLPADLIQQTPNSGSWTQETPDAGSWTQETPDSGTWELQD